MCVCAPLFVGVHTCTGINANVCFAFILTLVCRSVRPRLTVYVCQESPQESPLLERHATSENGEHSIPSSLHGKPAQCNPGVSPRRSACVKILTPLSPRLLRSVSCSVPGGPHSCRTDPQDGVCVQPSTGDDQPGVQAGSDGHTHHAQ